MDLSENIAAPSTPTGGAIAIVRLAGPDALAMCDMIFVSPHGKRVADAAGYTILHGIIRDGDRRIDDVLVSVFHAPNSYSGDTMVEIACHGSRYIVSEIMRLLVGAGARAATAGEFTMRAFLNGKMDLSQAEAVADTIAAESKSSLALADTQLRGGYSAELQGLRGELLKLASLLELELDFSEEDVEFADRSELAALLDTIEAETDRLAESFAVGNAVKQGVSVAIVGAPNVGKSTLLNRLAGEERAMVSDIAGTTRDTIEEFITIDGIRFRFIDTAGLRESSDKLENMGIERTVKAASKAQLIIEMFDTIGPDFIEFTDKQKIIRVLNKTDLCPSVRIPADWIGISAKKGDGIENLKRAIGATVDVNEIMQGETIVSNSRHYEALCRAKESLGRAREGLVAQQPTFIVAQDIREVLASIGEITGEITSAEILNSIFSKFCIGK